MTVKIDPSQIDAGIPHTRIMVAGLFGSLIFLYCTYLNGVFGTDLFSIFGGVAAVCALIWGSDAIKLLNSYGLATGVPSAGMIGLGSGIGAMIAATFFGVAAPLVAVGLAAVTGFVLGILANSVLSMKIPVMVQALTELSVAGAVILLGIQALITGRISGILTEDMAGGGFIGSGLVIVAFMLGAIAIQHPWNAVLPSGKQDRMFVLAAECGFLTMMMAAVMSFAFIGTTSAFLSLSIGSAGWLVTYVGYIRLSRRDAAAWVDTGPIPEVETDGK